VADQTSTMQSRLDSFMVKYRHLHADDKFKAVCGLSKETFSIIYIKYCGPATAITQPQNLFDLFHHYKSYNVSRLSPYVKEISSFGWEHERIRRMEEYLASVIDEIQEVWDGRYDRTNRLPNSFGREVIGCIDTVPIACDRQSDSSVQGSFYQGKYKKHVFKMQLICNHLGQIMWYSGPHFGVTHDLRLWAEKSPNMAAGDKILGDKAYVSAEFRHTFVTPFKKPARGQLSEEEKEFNKMHSFYRATVEHVFGYLKRYRILSSQYRGQVKLSAEQVAEIKSADNDDGLSAHCGRLASALKIIVHASNVHLKLYPKRTYHQIHLIPEDIPPIDRIIQGFRERRIERKEEEERLAAERMADSDIDHENDEDDRSMVIQSDSEEEDVEEGKYNPRVGTGKTIEDFKKDDVVEVYMSRTWWAAKVVYVARTRGTLSLRLVGEAASRPEFDPNQVRHANNEEEQ
jgi:hypothetical protein